MEAKMLDSNVFISALVHYFAGYKHTTKIEAFVIGVVFTVAKTFLQYTA